MFNVFRVSEYEVVKLFVGEEGLRLEVWQSESPNWVSNVARAKCCSPASPTEKRIKRQLVLKLGQTDSVYILHHANK